MALSRPVATLVWNGATTTGISGATSTAIGGIAYMGLPITKTAVLISNASTKAVTAILEGSMGHSTSWVALHAFTTGGTTGANLLVNSTATFVIDKVRLNVSANASTGIFKAWVAGSV